MALFYNQADQDIYTGGDHFIPQEQYRLGNFNPASPSIANASNTGGLTTIPQGGPYMGYPSYAAYLAAQPGGGGGGYGTWGNLDRSSKKTFKIGDRYVTGYKNLNSGLYQDYAGLNIQNLGLGKKEEDAEYPGLFHKVNLKAMLKNPGIVKSFFDRQDVEKQTELQKEIDAANFDAMQEAELGRNIAEYGTGDRPNTGMNAPGSGKGQSPTGGDVAGTPFADGGRIGYNRGRVVNPGGYAGDDEGGILEWIKSIAGPESETNPTAFGTQSSLLNQGSIAQLQDAIKSYEALMMMGDLDEEQLADYELKMNQLQALTEGAEQKALGGRAGFFYGGLATIL